MDARRVRSVNRDARRRGRAAREVAVPSFRWPRTPAARAGSAGLESRRGCHPFRGGESVMAFEVRFWGVRGSVASPGPDTAAVGGNTSSLEVRAADTRVLLDAGTGIRQLGDALLAEGRVD